MFLTTRGRYAVMAMVELACAGGKKPITSKMLAGKIEVEALYLDQLLSKLKHSGVICAVRGPGGGYVMNRDAQSIKVLDIMQAAEEPMRMTRCTRNSDKGCLKNTAMCKTHYLWLRLETHIIDFLSTITLDMLMDRQALNGIIGNGKDISGL